MGIAAIDGKVDKETITERVLQDGALDGGTDPSKLDIPKGHRLVALYTNDEDYHFNRIDVSPDGSKIAMTGKNGFAGAGEDDGGILKREYDAKDAFDPNAKKNVMNYSGSYTFARFFYVPEDGLNVGMDAHLIKEGKMEPKAEGESIEDYGKRVDVAYLEAATAGSEPAPVAQENRPLPAAELDSKLAGVEPMKDALPGQPPSKEMSGVMADYASSGPSAEPSQQLANNGPAQQMQRTPSLSPGSPS